MPTPAYIDLLLYLPVGGINGFELNGHDINGVGFVDSPFAGATFTLDPYRSILLDEFQESYYSPLLPSLLPDEPDFSVQISADDPSEVWAARGEAEVGAERNEASLTAKKVSLADEVSHISLVPPEYRTAYVMATHHSITSSDRADSDLDSLPPSQELDKDLVSYVPAEDRTSKVRRI